MLKRLSATSSAAVAVLTLAACGISGGQGTQGMLVWTTYGTGTSTYADVAAVAEAVTTAGGPDIRVVTSDTAIGRVAPLREGQAQMGRLGDEYIYAFEGDYEFAGQEWGPQEMRVVWGAVAPHGLLVRDDSGIDDFEDLEGTDFPRITANPSVNNKLDAFLAYGGLTRDDVNEVEVDYGQQAEALETGMIDVLFHQVYGPNLYQLESVFDVRWLSLDEGADEQIAALEEVAPTVEIGDFTGGPGQAEGQSDTSLVYALPFATYADTDEDLVYETVSAIHDNFGAYENSTSNTHYWELTATDSEPKAVPFHPGAVRFLEEQGEWSAEDEARNQELLEREERLQDGWEEFADEAAGRDTFEVAREWTAWKDENIPE